MIKNPKNPKPKASTEQAHRHPPHTPSPVIVFGNMTYSAQLFTNRNVGRSPEVTVQKFVCSVFLLIHKGRFCFPFTPEKLSEANIFTMQKKGHSRRHVITMINE